MSLTGALDVTLCTFNAPACKPLATAWHLSCKSVRLCVCDRAVKPPFDNALSAGRPAVALGYRSQLGKAEIETMRRRVRWRRREDDDSAIRRWQHEHDREMKSSPTFSGVHILQLLMYSKTVHQVNCVKYIYIYFKYSQLIVFFFFFKLHYKITFFCHFCNTQLFLLGKNGLLFCEKWKCPALKCMKTEKSVKFKSKGKVFMKCKEVTGVMLILTLCETWMKSVATCV